MKIVLFDVDGTLLDAHRAGRRALVRAFTEVYGLDGSLVDRVMDRVSFAGRTDLWILARAAGALEVRLDGRREAMVDGYFSALRANMAETPSRPLPGVPALLEALRARDDRMLGLLTGNLREGARIKLAACGLDGYFEDGGFGEDGLERAELARAAHLRFEERLGRPLDPRDVAVVGDTHHDVVAAKTRGFLTVAVATGWGEPEAVRQSAPDLSLDDLTDAGWLLGRWPD